MQVRSLGGEDPREEEMASHCSILTWRIPWTEEPGGLQNMGSQSQTRLRGLNTHTLTHSHTHPHTHTLTHTHSHTHTHSCTHTLTCDAPSLCRGQAGAVFPYLFPPPGPFIPLGLCPRPPCQPGLCRRHHPPGLCSRAHAGPAAHCALPTCVPAHSAGHLCSHPAHTLVLLATPASHAGDLPPLDITPQLLWPGAASPPQAVPGSRSSAVLCLGRGPLTLVAGGCCVAVCRHLYSGAIASPQLCQLLAAACWPARVPMSLVLTIQPSASPSVSP